MTVIIKKDEKIKQVIEKLGNDLSEETFIETFKEMFPKDWNKIVNKYQDEERKTKPGKNHPMPEPVKYLRNTLKVYINKHAK